MLHWSQYIFYVYRYLLHQYFIFLLPCLSVLTLSSRFHRAKCNITSTHYNNGTLKNVLHIYLRCVHCIYRASTRNYQICFRCFFRDAAHFSYSKCYIGIDYYTCCFFVIKGRGTASLRALLFLSSNISK